jgi:hypothetical protein
MLLPAFYCLPLQENNYFLSDIIINWLISYQISNLKFLWSCRHLITLQLHMLSSEMVVRMQRSAHDLSCLWYVIVVVTASFCKFYRPVEVRFQLQQGHWKQWSVYLLPTQRWNWDMRYYAPYFKSNCQSNYLQQELSTWHEPYYFMMLVWEIMLLLLFYFRR